MGSGNRVKFGLKPGLVFGMTVRRFPFALTLNLDLGCVWVSIGLGRGYDK